MSTTENAARQTLSQQLSPREEGKGKMQERHNARRDKEKRGKMEPKAKMGNTAEGARAQ